MAKCHDDDDRISVWRYAMIGWWYSNQTGGIAPCPAWHARPPAGRRGRGQDPAAQHGTSLGELYHTLNINLNNRKLSKMYPSFKSKPSKTVSEHLFSCLHCKCNFYTFIITTKGNVKLITLNSLSLFLPILAATLISLSLFLPILAATLISLSVCIPTSTRERRLPASEFFYDVITTYFLKIQSIY